jgi:4-amino-4-deoxy-L-arabinose transferase-like glycosyltransferase
MITFFFIFVWFLAGLGIFYLTKKICGLLAGITAFGIFAACPYFVFFSRIIWNTALVPLVSVLFFTSLYQIKENKLAVWWFLAGLFLGLGLNFSHSTLIWFPVLGFFAFWQFKNKILKAKHLGMILAGFILGELPVLIFELRHQFYNTKTFIFFIKYGILEGKTKGPVTDYHFIFALFPIFFLLWGKAIQLIEKKLNFTKAFFLSIILILSLAMTINWYQEWGTGMPKGWSLSKEEKVAKIICSDIGNQNFEIAETIDGDTRAYDLRFFLSFFGCPPLGVEDYQQADNLFLVTTQKRLPEKETVWEVKSLRPFKTIFKKDLGDELILFKLSRMNTLSD